MLRARPAWDQLHNTDQFDMLNQTARFYLRHLQRLKFIKIINNKKYLPYQYKHIGYFSSLNENNYIKYDKNQQIAYRQFYRIRRIVEKIQINNKEINQEIDGWIKLVIFHHSHCF
jgi:hypothetical protein